MSWNRTAWPAFLAGGGDARARQRTNRQRRIPPLHEAASRRASVAPSPVSCAAYSRCAPTADQTPRRRVTLVLRRSVLPLWVERTGRAPGPRRGRQSAPGRGAAPAWSASAARRDADPRRDPTEDLDVVRSPLPAGAPWYRSARLPSPAAPGCVKRRQAREPGLSGMDHGRRRSAPVLAPQPAKHQASALADWLQKC